MSQTTTNARRRWIGGVASLPKGERGSPRESGQLNTARQSGNAPEHDGQEQRLAWRPAEHGMKALPRQRQLVPLHLVAAALISLAACGGSDPDPDQAPDQPTPRVDCKKEPEKCR